MKILIVEPYFAGSHAAWAKGYQHHSHHAIEILSLPGQHWKWRMHGAAVTLAKRFQSCTELPDLIVASDMLDLTTFQALTREKTHSIPFAIYFHENQITYPWSPNDRDLGFKRDKHYGFINYSSALSSQKVYFNSEFHSNSFIHALDPFLRNFPDFNELDSITHIKQKCQVLPPGLDLGKYHGAREKGEHIREERKIQGPIILWNHRWEYDKNPQTFFNALILLDQKGLDFKIVLLGENFRNRPKEFDDAMKNLSHRIIHCGFVENFEDYVAWLWASDFQPITSYQEFFGLSFVEATYCGCFPLLPHRLSYPDIVPKELFFEHCYSHQTANPPKNPDQEVQDLSNFLTKKVKHFERNREFLLQKVMNQYRWENMAPLYDREFSTLLQ